MGSSRDPEKRVTVHTHLKEYKNNPAHELERGMMNLMAKKILL